MKMSAKRHLPLRNVRRREQMRPQKNERMKQMLRSRVSHPRGVNIFLFNYRRGQANWVFPVARAAWLYIGPWSSPHNTTKINKLCITLFSLSICTYCTYKQPHNTFMTNHDFSSSCDDNDGWKNPTKEQKQINKRKCMNE